MERSDLGAIIKLRLNSEKKKNKRGKNRKNFSSNNTLEAWIDIESFIGIFIIEFGTMEERILREANVATDIDF